MEKSPNRSASENGSVNQPDLRKSVDAVLGRLMEAAGVTSESALAPILGISQSSITKAKQRQQLPPSWLMEMAERYGVSLDWLAFGKGALDKMSNQPCGPELRMIPKVKARLSAGTGSLQTSGEVVGLYAFRTEFLGRKGNATEMVLMDVAGDSMAPEIRDGDTVLIDQSQTEVIAGKVYAVGMDEEVVVKQIDKRPGTLVLQSFNALYTPIEIDLQNESLNVRIIGRVIWWCREAR